VFLQFTILGLPVMTYDKPVHRPQSCSKAAWGFSMGNGHKTCNLAISR
jgi:hypothetical protein